jgi:alkylation response protein AidB-like acyl-CoA dehydrogenase
MDLAYTPQQHAFRAEVRAWLDAHVPAKPLEHFDASRDGFEAHRAWERTLKSGDWGMVTWPREYGGRGLDLIQWLIFEEEYYRSGAPGRVNQNGIFLLGPTLIEFGTPEQKSRFLPAMASGDEIWAQAWSEPQAGSDLAGVRATAVREGDEYVLNGHKIWSSRAVFADWAFGLFREPGTERHKGLSLIFFPLDAPGVSVNAIQKINGHVGFAEIFLEDVRVPAFNRLGDEGQGWHICMATAGFERGLMLRSPARYQVAAAKLAKLYKRHQNRVDAALEKDVVRAFMNAQAYALSIYSTASRLMAGAKIGPALAILGPHAEVLPHAPDAGDVGDWLDDYIFALAGPIYAGSNEIQRNIIAERMLGLPR